MRLILVRHGEPDYSLDCLTELGKLQAQAAAERLKDERIDEIYSSPFGRAKETAQYTGDLLNKPVRILDFMSEIQWKKKNGERVPGHPWHISQVMINEKADLHAENWTESKYYADVECSQVQFVQREFDVWLSALGYVRDGGYYKCVKDNNKTVALFSHGGSSSAVLAHLLNLQFPYVCASICPDFTAVTVLNFFDKKSEELFLPHPEIVIDSRHIKNCRMKNGV